MRQAMNKSAAAHQAALGPVRELPAQLDSTTGRLVAVLLGCLALVASSMVRVPVPGTDVPGTLQLLAVISCGLWLRPAMAAYACGLYLLMGTLGLPVFAAGSAGLFGMTGGYLAGFLLAAVVVSVIRGRWASRGFAVRAGLASFVGLAIVLTAGTLWRSVWRGNPHWRVFCLGKRVRGGGNKCRPVPAQRAGGSRSCLRGGHGGACGIRFGWRRPFVSSADMCRSRLQAGLRFVTIAVFST